MEAHSLSIEMKKIEALGAKCGIHSVQVFWMKAACGWHEKDLTMVHVLESVKNTGWTLSGSHDIPGWTPEWAESSYSFIKPNYSLSVYEKGKAPYKDGVNSYLFLTLCHSSCMSGSW
jgi:hypothetical protein